MRFLLYFLVLLTMLLCGHANEYKIFCYWNVGSLYREGIAKFMSLYLPLELCTHLGYAHVGIQKNGALNLNGTNREEQLSFLETASKLKRYNNIKLMVSVGGWKESSELFSNMVADMRKRDRFIMSVLDFLNKYKFDGIDIDWEFPTQLGGRREDRQQFVIFLEELNIILKESNYLLSVAVAAKMDANTLQSYDIPKISKYVDLINMITYDLRSSYSTKLFYNSPLYDSSNSVEPALRHWIAQGAEPAKLLLGIPFFGRTFILGNKNMTAVGASCKRPGLSGPTLKQPGFMAYRDFCQLTGKWTKKYDERAVSHYAYKANQWISYDEARSINRKLQVVRELGLGGAMVWSIDLDDYQGICGQSFGLLSVINVGLDRPITTESSVTEVMGFCPKNGFFRDTWYCQYYYECRDGQRYEYECLKGYFFDPKLGYCNLEAQVPCKQDFVTWRPGMTPYAFENFPINLKIVS